MSNTLDNPVWYSLSETHQNYRQDHKGLKFYKPEYCPFGGFIEDTNLEEGLIEYATLLSNFYIVSTTQIETAKLSLIRNLVCDQMLLDKPIELELTEAIVELKTTEQQLELFELVSLVQPGYFMPKTSNLGRYFGIYKGNNLVAVTGERMMMHGYTEINAVVTHPAHTAKGYAKQLIMHTVDMVFKEDSVPFLHVAEYNTHAISIYKKLGFRFRTKMNFQNFKGTL